MEVLLTMLVLLLIVFILVSIVVLVVDMSIKFNWKFVNDRKLFNYLVNAEFDIEEKNLRIRGISRKRVSNDNSIWYRWEIDGLGMIGRWTRSHRYLNKIYRVKKLPPVDKYKEIFGK